MPIDPQGAEKWERRSPVPLSTGHLPDQPQLDGYSKGCENLRARRASFNPPITPIETLAVLQSPVSGTAAPSLKLQSVLRISHLAEPYCLQWVYTANAKLKSSAELVTWTHQSGKQ